MFEQNLRQGLIIGFGSPMVFLKSPISAAFLGLACVVTLAPLVLGRFRTHVLSGPPAPELDRLTGTEIREP
jgi:TctA family transporter